MVAASTQSPSKMCVQAHSHCGSVFRSAVAETQGHRPSYEDAYAITSEEKTVYFWIFDGHRGDCASRFAAELFGSPEFSPTKDKLPSNRRIRRAFQTVDNRLRDHLCQGKLGNAGSTAVGALIAHKEDGTFSAKLVNCGDSRCVVVRAPEEEEQNAAPIQVKLPDSLKSFCEAPDVDWSQDASMVTWVASSCGDNRSQTKSMFWTCKDWSSRRNSSWRADSAAWWQSCGESQSWWLWFQECQPTCGWAKGLMLTRHLWSIRTTRRKCSSAGVRRPLGRHVNRGSGTIRSSEAPAQSTNGAGWHCTRTCWLQLGRRDSGQCHRAAGTAGSWRSRSGSERGWGRLIRCRKWHLILIAILPVSTYRFAQKLDRNQVCEVAQLPMCRTDMDHCSNYTLCESKRYNKKSFCKYKQYVAINEIYPFNIIACCICWRRHGRMAANLVSESESERDRRGRGTSTSLMKRPGWRFGTGDTGSKWPTDHRFQSPPHKLNSRNRLSSAALQILCWVLLSCFDLPPKYSAHKGNFKNEKLKETAVRIELSPLPHVRSQSETSILESWAFSFSMLFSIVSPSFHIFSCFKGRMNFASVASQLRPSVTQHRRTRTTTGPWHGPTPGEAQDGPGVQHSVLSTLDWTTGCLGIDGD